MYYWFHCWKSRSTNISRNLKLNEMKIFLSSLRSNWWSISKSLVGESYCARKWKRRMYCSPHLMLMTSTTTVATIPWTMPGSNLFTAVSRRAIFRATDYTNKTLNQSIAWPLIYTTCTNIQCCVQWCEERMRLSC